MAPNSYPIVEDNTEGNYDITPNRKPNCDNDPLPDTTNFSLILLGYLVDFDKIHDYQCQFRYENPTQAQQVGLQAAIVTNIEEQFASLKKLFIESNKCEKCRKSPMVAGSVHAAFANASTQAIWDELIDGVDEMKKFPLDVTPLHMEFIKRNFEKLEHAYRRDNVAAAGLC
ncbi:hypothetical protein ONS95_000219 [Cadophora gregata]|uniref:uncharacterized protein n=1 Tax=Cadophora gregata TaxID=51156 RepID=UPI0026DB7338|nr:uncharacterized protein ONS95_000219 [Cadophora gregata]KAK0115503.1 hypothetical protein ONS96_013957 [Cadophora gregata f. sp. sojae]KAK0128242.1 hypothetical protein ONS95_000219 [Cadophora gregata]